MKEHRLSTWKDFSYTILITICSLILVSSCSKKEAFMLSEIVPAAHGSVVVDNHSDKSYTIKIDIENLADAKRLGNPRNFYIAWLVSEDNKTVNIGPVRLTPGFLSKKNDATLKTSTLVKPSKIFITAENDTQTKVPTSEIVMSTRNLSY